MRRWNCAPQSSRGEQRVVIAYPGRADPLPHTVVEVIFGGVREIDAGGGIVRDPQ